MFSIVCHVGRISRHCLKVIHSRSDTGRIKAEGLPFTIPCYCTVLIGANIGFSHPKPSDFMLHVMPDVWVS